MKKLFFLVAFIATSFLQKGLAQDRTGQSQLSELLANYYGIKDALVAGNGTVASAQAAELISTAGSIENKDIPQSSITTLIKDATSITQSKDIKKQREHFAGLSNNMATLAKTVKLTTRPVYRAYCPMKKANWLSSNKEIKNPYYGNAMLTCGKVVETIN